MSGDEGQPETAASPTNPALDLGIAGYRDALEIGRGGFAIVYRAWQPAFERHVAVKVITTTLDADAWSRFERECVAIGALSGHPHIVTVYEHGRTTDGKPYLVMEFLPGGSLADRLGTRGRLPWSELVAMAIEIAGAMSYAHGASVLHRDVKPENILISRFGGPKLGDFGIARVHGQHETKSGVITASVAYAAPEVVSGARATVASDIYSLGSTLFAALAGHAPFVQPGDESLVPLLARIATEPVPDLRLMGVPDSVCRVVEQALAKDPASRQPSAAHLARQLQAAQAAAGFPVTPVVLDPAGGGASPPMPAANATADGELGARPDSPPTEHPRPAAAGKTVVTPQPPPAPPMPVAPPAQASRSRRKRVAMILIFAVGVVALITGVVDLLRDPEPAPARVLFAQDLELAAVQASDLHEDWVETSDAAATIVLPCNRSATAEPASSAATAFGIPAGPDNFNPQLVSTLFGFSDREQAAAAYLEFQRSLQACTTFRWENDGVVLQTSITIGDMVDGTSVLVYFAHTVVASGLTYDQLSIAEVVETVVAYTNLANAPELEAGDTDFVREVHGLVRERLADAFR